MLGVLTFGRAPVFLRGLKLGLFPDAHELSFSRGATICLSVSLPRLSCSSFEIALNSSSLGAFCSAAEGGVSLVGLRATSLPRTFVGEGAIVFCGGTCSFCGGGCSFFSTGAFHSRKAGTEEERFLEESITTKHGQIGHFN
jgi:hypothetical protein